MLTLADSVLWRIHRSSFYYYCNFFMSEIFQSKKFEILRKWKMCVKYSTLPGTVQISSESRLLLLFLGLAPSLSMAGVNGVQWFEAQLTLELNWVWILTWLLTRCVTLEKALNHSGLQFSHQLKGGNIYTKVMRLR